MTRNEKEMHLITADRIKTCIADGEVSPGDAPLKIR
jgi:hypothetical protein